MFPWSSLPLCKHCWSQRVARDAARCPHCGGGQPGLYTFPLDHLRLFFRNPWAALEPLWGWLALILVLSWLLAALSGSLGR